mmetsp:Transcript_35050/g.88745  ORF Transcript_35050/g.88745 Transcript_35050/m.88745 type:complete len:201 (+) Transcript_35050:134-736(+)
MLAPTDASVHHSQHHQHAAARQEVKESSYCTQADATTPPNPSQQSIPSPRVRSQKHPPSSLQRKPPNHNSLPSREQSSPREGASMRPKLTPPLLLLITELHAGSQERAHQARLDTPRRCTSHSSPGSQPAPLAAVRARPRSPITRLTHSTSTHSRPYTQHMQHQPPATAPPHSAWGLHTQAEQGARMAFQLCTTLPARHT